MHPYHWHMTEYKVAYHSKDISVRTHKGVYSPLIAMLARVLFVGDMPER
jgi:hypothetical protein